MIADLPKRPRHFDFEKRVLDLDEMRFLGSQTTFITLGFKDCPIGDEHIRELRNLSRLVRLWLEGTQVTDAALEHLAALPKLQFLILDRTRVNGEGLRHFHGHNSLKTLWLDQSDVTDATIGLVIDIPKLSVLRIAKTAVSFEGLLAVAAHPTLKVNGGEQFSADQMQQFEATQRQLAREARHSTVAGGDEAESAKRVLLAFFEAMNQWESEMDDAGKTRIDSEAERHDRQAQDMTRCAAIFEKYCTPKPRAYGRPSALSYSKPPGYTQETVVDTEKPSKQKIWIYTKDTFGFQRRYLVIRSRGEWRVDHREIQMDGWTQDYL
jgi:NTF2 fold immunity protein